MDKRDFKRAIDSIQPKPGMEMRTRRVVMQRAKTEQRGSGRKRNNLLQGSVIAAACCAVAALAVVITSFQFGGLGGGFVISTTQDQYPGAPGQRPSKDSSQWLEVELDRASGVPAEEGISFTARIAGESVSGLSPAIEMDQGAFTPKGEQAAGTLSGIWKPDPDPETEDGERFVATIKATNGNQARGKNKYLIATYHRPDHTLSVRVSDSRDG